MGIHYTADEWTTVAWTGCLPRGWMMNYGGPFSSVYPDQRDLAQFIHFLCVCERETLKAIEMKLNDVTRHQPTIDLLLSHSKTQTAPYSFGAYQWPSGTICPLQAGQWFTAVQGHHDGAECEAKGLRVSVCPTAALLPHRQTGNWRQEDTEICNDINQLTDRHEKTTEVELSLMGKQADTSVWSCIKHA